MGMLKKIGGIVLLLFSFGILLVFLLSFYNIIFKGGKFDLIGNIITIPLMIGLMIYLFKWGLKIIKRDEKVEEVDKSDVIRWHAFLGVSFFFFGISVLLGLIKIMSILSTDNVYFKIGLGLPLIFLVLGLYWIYDAIRNKYFHGQFWYDKINYIIYDFKKSFINGFGYILGVLFILYLAFAPLISFENLTTLNRTIDFIATLNIAFHATWIAFFVFTGKIR